MDTVELKLSLHQLIERMDSREQLEAYYEMMSANETADEQSSWNELSLEQQKELLDIVERSRNQQTLIPHESVKAKYRKWL